VVVVVVVAVVLQHPAQVLLDTKAAGVAADWMTSFITLSLMPLLLPLAVSIAIAIASCRLIAVSVNTDFLTAIALAVPLTMLQSLLAVTIVALYYWLHHSIGLIITYCCHYHHHHCHRQPNPELLLYGLPVVPGTYRTTLPVVLVPGTSSYTHDE